MQDDHYSRQLVGPWEQRQAQRGHPKVSDAVLRVVTHSAMKGNAAGIKRP